MELIHEVRTDSDGGPCFNDNCMDRFKVVDGPGGYLIRGKRPTPEMLAMVGQLPDDEGLVWVPDPIIERR
jgi:hypothetical protein